MKEITLRGYFYKCDDKYKKLTIIFQDESTQQFLMKSYSEHQKNPIYNNEFYVKFDPIKSFSFLDRNCEVVTPIQALLDKNVEMKVKINHYSFVDKFTKKKVIGWNINLVNIKPL